MTYKVGSRTFTRKNPPEQLELVLVRPQEPAVNGNPVWENLFDYQKTGVEFIEGTNFSCLIADPMGAGKTIELLAAIRSNLDILSPMLFIVKASLKYNWAREILNWMGPVCQDCNGKGCDKCKRGIVPEYPFWFIDTAEGKIPKGFPIYIISMDLIPRNAKALAEFGFKLVVIDESQHFKNNESNRTRYLRQIIEDVPRLVLVTGTPVMNNASEYWTSLNLLRPELFPSRLNFQRAFLDYDWEEKRYTGIKQIARDKFLEVTRKFVLRRPASEVLRDLPPFSRRMTVLEIDDPTFLNAYERECKSLRQLLESIVNKATGGTKFIEIIAILTKLRQIAGLAKVEECQFYVENHLAEDDREKICIGIHHHIVGDMLARKLYKHNVVRLDGTMTTSARYAAENRFRDDPECRIMIASTLAAGEGLNLQFCHHAILLERQWNTPREAQFEGRFYRIGTDKPVIIDYLVAKGSIDEWMSELIEKKRHWTNSCVEDGTGFESGDGGTSFNLMELAEMCVEGKLG